MAGYHTTFTFTTGEIATLKQDAYVKVSAIGADATVEATTPNITGGSLASDDTATNGTSGTQYTTIGVVTSGESEITHKKLGVGTKIRITTTGSAEVEFIGD